MSTGAPARCCCPAKRISASCRSRRRPAVVRSSPRARRRARDGGGRRHRRPLRRAGRRFDGGGADARGAEHVRRRRVFTRTPNGSRAHGTSTAMRAVIDETMAARPGAQMVKRHNTLLVTFYVVTRRVLARAPSCSPFSSGSRAACIPVTQGLPAARAVREHAAVHRRRSRPSPSSCRASTVCGAVDRASTSSSRCSSER